MLGTDSSTHALIIDDHALFREGLALLLRGLSPAIHPLHAANIAEAVRLIAGIHVELIFLDWWLRNPIEAPGALAALRLSLIHIRRCRRQVECRTRSSPNH